MSKNITIIKPEVIKWARIRCNFAVDEFASRMNVAADLVDAWENGSVPITLTQAKHLSKVSLVPFAMLFASDTPSIKIDIPDFRSPTGKWITEPSPELIETILFAQYRQGWLHDYRNGTGNKPLDFVGSASISQNPNSVASKIRNLLKIDVNVAANQKKWEDYFSLLVEKIEDTGVMLMRNGVVGDNTHRKLDVEEFRGFVLIDKYAPLIFINGADFLAAQMFTLLHEFTHILLGGSGISDCFYSHNKKEKFCNKVAAEFLAPSDIFTSVWRKGHSPQESIDLIKKHLRISSLVAILRAYDLGIIDIDQKEALWKQECNGFIAYKKRNGGGGNYYSTKKYKIGPTLSRCIVSEAVSGNLLLGEAFKLLQVNSYAGMERLGMEVGVCL